MDTLILTTTPSIEGRPIKRYCGIVTGEVILGVNILKDFFGSVRDIVGGRSKTYESELQHGRETALGELQSKAKAVGANAVVGVSFDYEVLGSTNGMLMIVASGTAVEVS